MLSMGIQVGMRVRCLQKNTYAQPGTEGIVRWIDREGCNDIAVEWDRDVGGHQCDRGEGYGDLPIRAGHGEWMSPW